MKNVYSNQLFTPNDDGRHKFQNIADPSKVAEFSFSGIADWARVVDVHDGDTIKVIMDVPGFGLRRLSLRLLGIDTPEVRSASEEEKRRGLLARDFLFEKLVLSNDLSLVDFGVGSAAKIRAFLQKNVVMAWIVCHGNDKYGRILADVCYNNNNNGDSVEESSLNVQLLQNGYAVAYDGKAKPT
jgi:endonuclease YncB( thermonuclease family)